MVNIKQISAKTQVKLKQYMYRFRNQLDVPEYKFLSDTIFGILKGKHIHLAKIARSLLEKITPKKTQERLSYHLGKEGLYKRLQTTYYKTHRYKISSCRYLIFDGSDIVKQEAEKMEGLSLVRDGSRSAKKQNPVIANGYHWDNIIGISEDGKNVVPVYSEIYSNSLDTDYSVSENRKIIKVVKEVSTVTNSEQILVIDRGGDRRVLINNFIRLKQSFIIRQDGRRHLFYKGRSMPLKKVSRKAKLEREYTVIRNHNNKTVKHIYHVGALPVKFPTACLQYPIDHPLWLIMVREEGKGYSWFLCSLPADDKFEAIQLAMKGYQYRWKVEEFHRQIKQDYHLEEIRYQRYEVIQTLGSLLVIVMGFLATINTVFIRLLLFSTRLLEKNRFKDIPDYIFYRLSEGIRISLAGVNKFIPSKRQACQQSSLNLFP